MNWNRTKKILTYLLPAAGGLAAARLRYVAVQTAVDPGTGIPISPVWIKASYLAIAAVIAAALVYSLVCGKKQVKNPELARSMPCKAMTAVASLLFIAAGGAAFFSLAQQGSSVMTLIQAVLALACGGAVFARFQADPKGETAGVLALIPVFYVAFVLLSFYRANNANPLIYSFATELFTYVAVMFALYAAAAVYFGKSRPGLQLFCCLAGIFLLVTVLCSDNLLPFFTKGHLHLSMADLLSMAGFLSLLCAQLWPLETEKGARER